MYRDSQSSSSVHDGWSFKQKFIYRTLRFELNDINI